VSADRANLIAVLEAHYGRIQALHVKQTAQELQKAAKRIADGTHPQLTGESQAPRRTAEELLQHVIRVSCEQIYKDLEEARQALTAAARVRDDELQYFVNWRTLPQWREQMIKLGYSWDDENMRWIGPDGW
jgi:hypothetical protein